MEYVAYSALLGKTEERKKKACILWANIKLKLIDNNEMQEFTMLQCLKSGANATKKFGINIQLDDYDLNDLCLRELKGLFPLNANFFLNMKKTLAEIGKKLKTL